MIGKEILTPNELDTYIASIPCMIEGMMVSLMKKAGVTELSFDDPSATARNANQEEEAYVLSLELDEKENTIRLRLDTVTDCDWGYISDQTTDDASAIYNAFYWPLASLIKN